MNGRSVRASLAIVALVAWGLTACSGAPSTPIGLPCHATSGADSYALDTDQAADAATIAAVANRLGMPDHAVTIALAAALQESKLYNLPYGDLDSLGLFQQRPSQGWGTPAEIMSPRYAATVFYTHLATVAGWQDLPVAMAVQAVQHSAAPAAYAQWEDEARVLAQALTGELPAAFTCQLQGQPTTPLAMTTVSADLTADLGPPTLGAPLEAPRGWQVAGWLIGNAAHYGITTVTFGDQRWSAHSGKWTEHRPASDIVEAGT